MTLEELAARAWGPIATLTAGILGGGGLWKWLSAKEAAKPGQAEQAGVMMQNAFSHMSAEVDRLDAALKVMRDDAHRLRNELANLAAAYGMVVRVAQGLVDAMVEAGVEQPSPPRGMTAADVDRLMTIPTAPYTFAGTGPVSNKDNGR